MSRVEYNHLLLEISQRLDELNKATLVYLTCEGRMESSAQVIPGTLFLFQKLQDQKRLAIDQVGLLKDFVNEVGERLLLRKVEKFEEKRKEYKELLEQTSRALDESNQLQQLIVVCIERVTLEENERNSQTARILFEKLEGRELFEFGRLEFLKEILSRIQRQDLVKEIQDFEKRRTYEDTFERWKAQAVQVAGDTGGRIIGVLNMKTVFGVAAAGITLLTVREILTRWSTYDQLVTCFQGCVLPAGSRLIEVSQGCVCFTIQVDNLTGLTALWNMYEDGTLRERLFNFFVTDEMKTRAGGEENVELTVTIEKEEYEKAYFGLAQEAYGNQKRPPERGVRWHSDSVLSLPPRTDEPLRETQMVPFEKAQMFSWGKAVYEKAAQVSLKTWFKVGERALTFAQILVNWESVSQFFGSFGDQVLPAGTELADMGQEGVCFTVQANTSKGLNTLWNMYQDGTLKARLYDFVVTDRAKHLAEAEENIELTVKIEEEEYERACSDLNNEAKALFRSGGEEIPEASGQVQQLTIQEEDGEELESEQEQEPDRIKIHEGTLTSKDVHWNIKLGAVHLAFPRDAVSEPTLITVHRWKPTVLSPPLQEHEALVSNVIEISSNSQEAFKFEAEVKMSFTHSSPGLHGYELVLYKRNDNETGAWEEVTDVEDFKTISDFEEEYQSSQDIPNLHFPVVQADITECATYAVVSRLRLSPEFTITSNGGSFALPKYPSISVTIPENAVTSKTRIPLRLKVQEVPREEFEANEILIGPILRIVCHKPIEFLKPVTITLPVSLGDARHDSPDPTACRVRILFLSSDGEQKEWREITEDLKKPVTFDGTTVKFEVERFSGYSCLIDWLADSSTYKCVIAYLSSLIWTQPQLAVFFAYFPPEDRPDSQDILHLICCPYQLREKVRDEIKNQANVPTPSDSSSHIKMIPGRDKAYVSLKKGIRAIEEVDMEEFYLQFISDELHKVQVPIRVIDDRGLSGVEFFKTPKFEKSTLLCQLYFRLSPLKRKLNRTPVEFFGIPVNDEVLSNPRPEHVLQIGRQFVGSKVYDDLLSRFIKGNINQKQTIQSFYEALAGLKIEIQDKCFEALVKELSNCNEYGFVVDRLQEGKDAVCKSLKTNGDVKKIVLEKAEYRWKNLARELGFIEGRIDAISEEEKDNCEECCYKVLQKWYQENGEMATIRRVMVALTRIGLADINNNIVDCLNLRRQDQM